MDVVLTLVLLTLFASDVSSKQTYFHYNLCYRRKVADEVQIAWFSPLSSYGKSLINELSVNNQSIFFENDTQTQNHFITNPKFKFKRLEPIGKYEYKLCSSVTFQISGGSTPKPSLSEIRKLLEFPPESHFLYIDAIPSSIQVTIPAIVCFHDFDPVNLYEWPDTESNTCVNLLCQNETNNPIRHARRCCLQHDWGPVNLSKCNHTDFDLPVIESLESSNNITQIIVGSKQFTENVELWDRELEFENNSSSLFSGKNFSESIQAINELFNASVPSARVETYDAILSVVSEFVNQANNSNHKDKDKEEIKRIVERIALNCPLNKSTVSLNTPFISMVISDLNKFQGKDKITVVETVTSQGVVNLILEPGVTDTYSTMVVLPVNLSVNSQEKRIAVYSFKDATLFDMRYINSKVYTILIPMLNHRTTLTDNITLKFNFENSNPTSNLQCVFWKQYHNMAYWSTEGCTLIDGNKCTCNHLSSFATMNMKLPNIVKEQHRELTIISVVGCSICVFTLSATLFTYIFFNDLLTDVPSRILMYISGNLLIEELFYLISLAYAYTYEEDDDIEDYVGCKIIAVILHYFQLASLAWMGANGFYMYRAVTKVFGEIVPMKRLVIGTCGTPLVIIIITAAINFHDHYGYQHGMCWLMPMVLTYSFIIPIAAMLVLNFYVFYVVFGTVKRASVAKKGSYIGFQAKGCASIIVNLGLSWTFAFISMGFSNISGVVQIIFAYLFVITNSVEGFFIFVFYCWLKQSSRDHWTRFTRKIINIRPLSPSYTAESSFFPEESTAIPLKGDLRILCNGENVKIKEVVKKTRSSGWLATNMLPGRSSRFTLENIESKQSDVDTDNTQPRKSNISYSYYES